MYVTNINNLLLYLPTAVPFALQCGATQNAGDITFDCSSDDIDLATADLQCFLDGVLQSACTFQGRSMFYILPVQVLFQNNKILGRDFL